MRYSSLCTCAYPWQRWCFLLWFAWPVRGSESGKRWKPQQLVSFSTGSSIVHVRFYMNFNAIMFSFTDSKPPWKAWKKPVGAIFWTCFYRFYFLIYVLCILYSVSDLKFQFAHAKRDRALFNWLVENHLCKIKLILMHIKVKKRSFEARI